MRREISFGLAVLFWSTVFLTPAFATHDFNNNNTFGAAGNAPITTNSNVAALWLNGVPTGDGTDINITNQFLRDVTVTNFFSANNAALNFIRVISGNAISGTGCSNVTLVVTTNIMSNFGFQIGSNSTLIIANTATFGSNANTSFDLGKNAAKGLGTLIISNGAIAFLNFTNAIRNDGTIMLVAAAGQHSQINYGQNNSSAFTNNVGGTIVKTADSGTGSFIGEFGGANKSFINQGTITVKGGPMRLDPRDAFNNGGFRNTGFVQVDTNAVGEIRRTTNAWTAATANMPTNSGTIFMNGGELRTFDSDGAAPGTNTTRVVVNASGGIIRGNGLLDFTIRNEAVGSILEARDGTLSCVASVNNNGTWVSTNFGGNASVLSFTTGGFDLGGGTLLNSNGTIRLTGGANTTISTSYRQNSGTIDFAGVGNLWIANSASADSLTNEFVIKKTAPGIGAIITGHGSGQNNYGFYNRGTLDITGGGRFSINTSNAFSQAFQNLASGTVAIGNACTVRVVRTSAAWGAATSPTNSGTITLTGGVLETADDSGVNSTRFLRNVGVINGNGTITASITNGSGGVISPGLSIGTNSVGGSVVAGSNSTLNVELGSLAGQNDLLSISGNLTLDANSILTISGGAVGNVYTVMTFSARSGTFGTNSPGYNVTYGSTAISIAPIPATHTISASAGANGAIAPSGSVIVTNGNDQAFTITPASCYSVADVLVDSLSVGAVSSYTFSNVTADHTISASFAINTYTITASAGANGSISPSGAVGVNCGDDQSFTITPASGYHIADVLVDSVSVGPVSSYSFLAVGANHTISASFAINTYNITATAGANGSIAPSGTVSVNHSNNQSFTISPDACYHVADVLVDSISVGAVSSYTFSNVVAAHTIDASFALDTYTITATAGANGSISPVGVIGVNCGTNQDFTITGDPGHPIVDVLVDGSSVGAVTNYTFSNVTTNHTIDASFATNLFQIISIKREGADIRLTWTTAGGHDYIVQTNAPPPGGSYTNNFSDLITISVPGIGESSTNYLDGGAVTNAAPGQPCRYYRIRLGP
jgi:hypothetical protein